MTANEKTTQSALDEMVAAVRNRKDATQASAGLTPVGTEKKGPLDGSYPGLAFPYDDADMMQAAIKHGLELVGQAKAELDFVGKGLIDLAKEFGLGDDGSGPSWGSRGLRGTSTSVDKARESASAQQAREREADARAADRDSQEEFQNRLAEQAAAAQAATFGDAPAEVTGWQCPDHGDDNLVMLTSRKNRKYAACKVAGCVQFEK